MKRLGLVLLSGGLDSTTVAALARKQGFEIAALTVHYGQAHSREVEAASRIAELLNLRHRIVDVEFFRDVAWYSALTHPEKFHLPSDRTPELMAKSIPITYVPLRNTLLLTLGAAYLESEALSALDSRAVQGSELEAVIFIAANAIDYSGYPDCRPEYYQAAAETLRLGSKLGTEYNIPFRIETPLINTGV
jgi:7-cyano-7-deazaguanine synthase